MSFTTSFSSNNWQLQPGTVEVPCRPFKDIDTFAHQKRLQQHSTGKNERRALLILEKRVRAQTSPIETVWRKVSIKSLPADHPSVLQFRKIIHQIFESIVKAKLLQAFSTGEYNYEWEAHERAGSVDLIAKAYRALIVPAQSDS